MKKTLAWAIALTILTGCSRPHPIIAINVARDEAYAKGVCDFLAASGRPCDSPANAGEIETAFRTEFLANPACSGITITTYDQAAKFGPNEFILSFNAAFSESENVNHVSVSDSTWQMSVPNVSSPIGDLNRATTTVCQIVKGNGGKTP
jgi:hypothetical protein